MWVTDSVDGVVSEIDPNTDRVMQTFAVGAGVWGITVGPDSVWAGSGSGGTFAAGGTLWRIDPVTKVVVKAIPIGGYAFSITATEEAVWVTNAAHCGTF